MTVVLAASSLVFTSCSDNVDNPVNPQDGDKRYVLSEMTHSFDVGVFWHFFFSYDDAGRLILEESYQTNTDFPIDRHVDYTYGNNVILEDNYSLERIHTLHLNAAGLLVDYEYYADGIDEPRHYIYQYDDSNRLVSVIAPGDKVFTLTWEDGEIVSIVDNGGTTITIVPSSLLVTNGFCMLDNVSGIDLTRVLLGVHGTLPRHQPATVASFSQTESSTISVERNYSYTVTDGLLTNIAEQKTYKCHTPSIDIEQDDNIDYVLVWKEL